MVTQVLEPLALATARLLLRPFQAGDEQDVFTYASDPEFAFFAMDRPPMTLEDARAFVSSAVRTPWRERVRFAITLTDRVIGNVDLHPDWAENITEIGYAVARERWNQGIATEAARAAVEYAFDVMLVDKVFARADPRNAASLRVLEKVGMTREGLLRSHVIRHGERADRVLYGILRDEWTRR